MLNDYGYVDIMPHLTLDTFFNGKVRVMQNTTGYRFSIDSVLLAYHSVPRHGDKVLDLGTGCGIIPMLLVFRHPYITVYGAEVQSELAALAVSNVKENQMEDRITVLFSDMKLLRPTMTDGPVDLVVCNPPYRKPGSGRINPDKQRAVARHEVKVNLLEIIQTAHRMLRTAGKFITIYTAERTTDILAQMRMDDIEPKFLRMIHSRRNTDAKLILIEGIKGARQGLKIAPPVIVYDNQGDYTNEVKQMFKP